MSFKIPVLISYWVLLKDKQNKMLNFLIKNKDMFRLVVDSGAFSAFTQGKAISVEDYCSWIKDTLHPAAKRIQIDGYFQLDVIGDQKVTKDNLVKHNKLGTDPIPIFTRTTDSKDFQYLNSLVSYGWTGIGGIKGTSKEYPKWILENCSDTSKLHLLGFANYDFIAKYKPKSFDSSDWYCGGRFGTFFTKDRKRLTGRLTTSDILGMGFQDKDLEKINNENYRRYTGLLMNAQQASACSCFLKYAKKVDRFGLTSYLVVINEQQLEVLKRCYEYFIENKPIDLFTKGVGL